MIRLFAHFELIFEVDPTADQYGPGFEILVRVI